MEIHPAIARDAVTILTLRHAAEDWLRARGIDQWTPREVPLTVIEKQVLRGEFFVARNSRSAQIIGAVRLIWSDPEIWGESAVRAAYVHGLVIDRSLVGVGLGRDLLTWAARRPSDSTAPKRIRRCAGTTATSVSRRLAFEILEDSRWCCSRSSYGDGLPPTPHHTSYSLQSG